MKQLRSFVFAVLAALLIVSCGSSSSRTVARSSETSGAYTPEVIQTAIQTMGKTHPEGFTLDVRTLQEPAEGIAVAYAATRGARTRREIYGVAAHAISHDGYVGGWADTETGVYYYDSVKLFPEDHLPEALEFAKENGQKTIFIISQAKEVPVSTAERAVPAGN